MYKAISEGIINLADRFFEMEYLEAQKGLEIYKESIVDNSRLQAHPCSPRIFLVSRIPICLCSSTLAWDWNLAGRLKIAWQTLFIMPLLHHIVFFCLGSPQQQSLRGSLEALEADRHQDLA